MNMQSFGGPRSLGWRAHIPLPVFLAARLPCSPPAQTAWTSATGSAAWTLAFTCSEKLFLLFFSWWTPACPSDPCSRGPSRELLSCVSEQRALCWKALQLWAFPPPCCPEGPTHLRPRSISIGAWGLRHHLSQQWATQLWPGSSCLKISFPLLSNKCAKSQSTEHQFNKSPIHQMGY